MRIQQVWRTSASRVSGARCHAPLPAAAPCAFRSRRQAACRSPGTHGAHAGSRDRGDQSAASPRLAAPFGLPACARVLVLSDFGAWLARPVGRRRPPRLVVEALRELLESQAGDRLAAGIAWQDTGLVFTTQLGTVLDAANVPKMFRRVCKEAGIGVGWTPRELRTSFVSLMSHRGVSIEEIAHVVGHASTRTIEVVYRRELRPVITTGAEIMDEIFGAR